MSKYMYIFCRHTTNGETFYRFLKIYKTISISKSLKVWKNTNLVFKEDTTNKLSTGNMVDITTALFEAAERCTRFHTHDTFLFQATFESLLYIHQGSIQSLVNLLRPQGTVQMGPLVNVHIEQPEISLLDITLVKMSSTLDEILANFLKLDTFFFLHFDCFLFLYKPIPISQNYPWSEGID